MCRGPLRGLWSSARIDEDSWIFKAQQDYIRRYVGGTPAQVIRRDSSGLERHLIMVKGGILFSPNLFDRPGGLRRGHPVVPAPRQDRSRQVVRSD